MKIKMKNSLYLFFIYNKNQNNILLIKLNDNTNIVFIYCLSSTNG